MDWLCLTLSRKTGLSALKRASPMYMHLKPLRDGISGSVKGELDHIHLYSLIYRF